jgi:hypothetical protein
VAVSDTMISMDWTSGDMLSAKTQKIDRTWRAMFSGSDISPVMPILERVTKRVSPTPAVDEIKFAFKEEYAGHVRSKAETQVLSVFGYSVETFRNEGLKKLGPTLFSQLFYEIKNVSMDLEFLVFGFDGKAHVFTVSHPGAVSDYGVPGFWSIGNGCTSALGMLYNIGHKGFLSPQRALYNLCAAKFASESAAGVGKGTFALVFRGDGMVTSMVTPDLEPIRTLWEAEGRPRVPASAESAADQAMREGERQAEHVQKRAEAAGPGGS